MVKENEEIQVRKGMIKVTIYVKYKERECKRDNKHHEHPFIMRVLVLVMVIVVVDEPPIHVCGGVRQGAS